MHRQKPINKKRVRFLVYPVIALALLLAFGGVAVASDSFASLFRLNHDSKTYSVYKVEVDVTELPPNEATITVIHKDFISGDVLQEDTFIVTPGSYGSYDSLDPADFAPINYRPGVLAPTSDPASGDIDAGETITIVYTYVQFFFVVYSPNGGNVIPAPPDPIDVDMNGVHTVINAGFTRFDYQFNGYNTAPDGTGIRYFPNDEITITDNFILYAHWIQPS